MNDFKKIELPQKFPPELQISSKEANFLLFCYFFYYFDDFPSHKDLFLSKHPRLSCMGLFLNTRLRLSMGLFLNKGLFHSFSTLFFVIYTLFFDQFWPATLMKNSRSFRFWISLARTIDLVWRCFLIFNPSMSSLSVL